MQNEPQPKPKAVILPKTWEWGLGPYYIGAFLSIVFFDRIGARSLAVGGLGWSTAGILVSGMLCYLLLFRVPATWGRLTGRPLSELAESTFGRAGARWIPGSLLGWGALLWFVLSLSQGIHLTLIGLESVGLIGPESARLRGLPFILTSIVWGTSAALAGRWLLRLIAAIMFVYPVFPAIVLAGAMFAMLGGLPWFAPSGIDPLSGQFFPPGRAGIWTVMTIIQLVLGFFAMAGLMGADWGSASTSMKDVNLGGWVGTCLAPVVIATMALVTLGGYGGRLNRIEQAQIALEDQIGRSATPRSRSVAPTSTSSLRVEGERTSLSYQAMLQDGVGGRPGAAALFILSLAALAPSVYASSIFGHRWHETLPKVSRTRWTLVLIVVGVGLTCSGLGLDSERLFLISGSIFAPVVGCIAADYWKCKGVWPGPRPGWNLAGGLSWFVGSLVGLTPLWLPLLTLPEPTIFWAYLAAFLSYTVLSRLGFEACPIGMVSTSAMENPVPNAEVVR